MASEVTSNWKLSVPVTKLILSFVGVKDTIQASKVCTVFRTSSRMDSLWYGFARQYHITLCGNNPRRELGDRILKVNETMRYILHCLEREVILDKNPINEYEQHCKYLQADQDCLLLWIERESKSTNDNPLGALFT